MSAQSPQKSLSAGSLIGTSSNDDVPQQFQRCLVMAGGGFRFGYYLGIYAACQELGKTPDVIVASCGATIAGTIIHHLPDNQQRLAWLTSPQMHAFWRGLQANPQKSLLKAIGGVAKRALFANDVKRIPDLFQDYLFEIPAVLPLPENTNYEGAPDLAIVAGRLLFSRSEVGQLRGTRKLYAETIFSSERVASLLNGMSSPLAGSEWKHSAVAPDLVFETTTLVTDAVRASIADMYYFRCHQIGEHHYLGGVLDLFPIEIARKLGREVMMERKGLYSKLIDLPALRLVLGIDGNQRLHRVFQQQADYWVDTADMEQALVKHQISKQLFWLRNRLALKIPERHEDFVEMINLQWQYGYQKTIAALAVDVKI
ncbi:patatin-like phospholipase family protein [Undibacterium sp. SXout20W]|uniref:patatin-like phospholipase family protein n=1 Tax=Undibacterium sp. SXout20W TaxID=3413051 RepID=UPI003BF40D35